ncbi:FAD-binding protein [Thermus filiformis]|uniref:2-hydroxy-acid oxidase n=1 Tax=Thermus filiformis TaxID=276 RepID=A0A0A2WNY7_THEFI|nr:FAD-binding protein [Thermus filiformis]KGQ21896.1 2-hydroxy-acid oxidase [Thermus filiformis]
MRPRSVEEVQEAVRQAGRLRVQAGGTKPALSAPREGEEVLDLSGLRGVLEYAPEEFVFTALAGTPVAEVEALLRAHGQHLPFHPPLAHEGATLGGTVAAGLSGPLRHRFGGVRDFILGVRFVDGEGRLVRAGGKVVKNAAGFGFHRLMVGSLGAFGVMVELSFKVFPYPRSTATLRLALGRLEEALERMERLLALDLMALDLEPPATLWVRLGGLPESLPLRVERLQALLGGGEVVEEDEAYWEEARRLAYGPLLVKIPAKLPEIPRLEALLAGPRRYIAGGEAVYAGLEPEERERLKALGVPHLVLKGEVPDPLFPPPQDPFFLKVKRALDPRGRFPLS